MNGLFDQLMQRKMGMQPHTPAPPSAAVGMFSQYQPPPMDRKQGWTAQGGPQKPQPNQQTQAIGAGPGAATPPMPQPPPPPPQPMGGSPVVPGGPPMPPNPPAHEPPQAKRFQNAQMMQQAFANGWQPNPMLLKALLG